MGTIDLLKLLIREISLEKSNHQVVMRGGPSGMDGGAAHPIIPRKPLMGFGKSNYEYDQEIETEEENIKQEPVRVSRAFEEDEEYELVLEGLLKCNNLT